MNMFNLSIRTRTLVLLGSLGLWSNTAYADVLLFTPQADLEAIGQTIAPIVIQTTESGAAYIDCTIVSAPNFQSNRAPAWRIIAWSPDRSLKSAEVEIASAFANAQNEVDSIHDLKSYYGAYGENLRPGSRRYMRALIKRIAHPEPFDYDPSDGIYDGGLLFHLKKLSSTKGQGISFEEFEAGMDIWTKAGGIYREAPFQKWTAINEFEPTMSLIGAVALERRFHNLDTGFEPAAMALLRLQAGLGLNKDTPFHIGEQRLRTEMLRSLARALESAAPGAVSDHDPQELQNLAMLLDQSANPVERAKRQDDLTTALGQSSEIKQAGRAKWVSLQSALDPSELANVWCDVFVGQSHFSIQKTSTSIMHAGALGDTVRNLYAFTAPTYEWDLRKRDRHRIWPRILELCTHIFEPTFHPDPGSDQATMRTNLLGSLWSSAIYGPKHSKSQGERAGMLMAAAHWQAAIPIDRRAAQVLRNLLEVAEAKERLQNKPLTEGESEEQRALRVEHAESLFQGELAFSRSMAEASQFPTRPDEAFAKQFALLKQDVPELRKVQNPNERILATLRVAQLFQ